MVQRLRLHLAVLAVALLAGCAVAPTQAPPDPIPATPKATEPATRTSPMPSPSPAVQATVPSIKPVLVVPSAAAAAGAAWTGIAWRKLAPDDPLAQVRSMTRWQGGFVALGDPAAVDGGEPTDIDYEPVHTRVWVSTDGARWDMLDASVFGARTILLGVGATADGIAAMTLQAGASSCDPEIPQDCWSLEGPLEAWTSPDARVWTAHAVPGVEFPAGMNLEAGTWPFLVVASRGRPAATSQDGAAWDSIPASAFPRGWRLEDVVAFDADLVAVGRTARKTLVLTSADGRTWARHALPAACAIPTRIVVGPAGLIVEGTTEGDGHAAHSGWCSSLDGRAWGSLEGLPPLGTMPDRDAQECWKACPDGSLRGDGERMLAYRGWGNAQAGWTSLDGRTWAPLTFTGRPETSTYWLDDECTQSLRLLPVGLTCTATGGSAWFGEPQS